MDNGETFDVLFLLSRKEQLNIINGNKVHLRFDFRFLAKGRKISIYRLELGLDCFKAETALMFLFVQIETPVIFTFVCCIKTLLDSVMSCTMQHDILRVTFSIALTGSSGKTSVSGTRK